jgi:type IV pilus assembly protein PilE
MQTTNPSDLSTGHSACNPPQRSLWSAGHVCERGFTLIEVMIVVAIVAILATIALPSYQDSVRKSRRADAVLALQRIQIEQEKFRAECPSYAAGFDTARVCNAATPANNRLALATSSSDGYYTLNLLPVVNATQYTATATAVTSTSQASDTGCTVLTLAVTGLTLTRTPAECWTR